MSRSGCRVWGVACWFLTAAIFVSTNSYGAIVVAGPGEAGLRAAIQAAHTGDTVMLTNYVELQSTVVIDKQITLTVSPSESWRISVSGRFDGELIELSADGIIIEWLRLYGDAQTDALRIEGVSATLRDCTIMNCRRPVVSEFWFYNNAVLQLERVTVSGNQRGVEVQTLEAKHCTFSGSAEHGIGVHTANLDGCVIENNHGYGLFMINGNVKNCVLRYNSDVALWFDPDNGYMCLNSCLFYANPGGGIYLREGAYATIDNCTFTRHTGAPAVIVNEAHDILFRHCTVSDNVVIGGGDPWNYPYHPPGATFWINSAAKLENCLIADNPTADDPNASGLIGDWIDGGGNIIGGPAHLSGLRDNGGPTLSLMPLVGSPAIDAGRPSDVVRDARGLSRQAGAAPDAGAIETNAGAVADTDADGMPDTWERLHGLNPDDATDAASDSDRDGQSALAEYKSGTDPADAQSVHRVAQILVGPNSIYESYPRYGYVTWIRYPGVFYHVEISNDLRNWRRTADTALPGGRELWWSLGQVQPNSPATYYRVVATR